MLKKRPSLIAALVFLSLMSSFAHAVVTQAFYVTADDPAPSYHYLNLTDLGRHQFIDGTLKLYTFTIDPKKQAQSYLGVGSSLEEATVHNLMVLADKTKRAKLLQQLFGHGPQDFNWNFVRVTLGSSDFTPLVNNQPYYYSYADIKGPDANLLANFNIHKEPLENKKIQLIKEAMAIKSDLLFFASAWSPPGWMKEPDSHNKFNTEVVGSNAMIGGTLKSQYVNILATYYLKTLQAYAAEGIRFHAISELNEPCVGRDTVVPYPNACIEVTDAKKLVAAMKAQFSEKNINTQLWVNDYNFGNGWEIVNKMMENPSGNFDGVAYHSYYGNVQDMKTVADKYQKNVYMTEFMTGWMWFNQKPTSRIVDVARLLEFFHQGSSSYINWVTLHDTRMGDPSGKHLDDIHKDAWFPPNLIETTDGEQYRFDIMAYALGSISKYVKQNAYLLDSNYYDNSVDQYQPTEITAEVKGQLPTISQLTFENPDHSLVTIMVNTGEKKANVNLVSANQPYPIKITLEPHAIETLVWTMP